MTLSEQAQNLLRSYENQSIKDIKPQGGTVIHVDEIASKFALFYEKARSIVDYHDEHLLRKAFIFRSMRRRLLFSGRASIAEPVIKELIRAGYLPNDTIPDTKISEVQAIIDNYHKLTDEAKGLYRNKSGELSQWILDIAVNAIEECLFPPDLSDELAFNLMFETIGDNLSVRGSTLSESEKKIQLFIAMQHTYLKADSRQLKYRLLKIIYPNWSSLEGERRKSFLEELPGIKKDFDKLPRAQYSPFFLKLCNRYRAVFYMVRDMLNEVKSWEELKQILLREQDLEDAIKSAYNRRIKKEFSRIQRIAFFSVISFFFSKIAVALLVEIPIEKGITDSFSLPITIATILFPPALMFVAIALVRLPSKENIKLVLLETKKFLYNISPKEYAVEVQQKRNKVMDFAVKSFYTIVSIGIIYVVFDRLLYFNFSIANSIIFIFFTSLVMATGVKIHNRIRALSLEKEKAGILSFVLDLVAIPFITMGQWVIGSIMRFNIITLGANLLIELPFQVFVEFIENFRRFISFKKEEIE